jgi:hypothetical protein
MRTSLSNQVPPLILPIGYKTHQKSSSPLLHDLSVTVSDGSPSVDSLTSWRKSRRWLWPFISRSFSRPTAVVCEMHLRTSFSNQVASPNKTEFMDSGWISEFLTPKSCCRKRTRFSRGEQAAWTGPQWGCYLFFKSSEGLFYHDHVGVRHGLVMSQFVRFKL